MPPADAEGRVARWREDGVLQVVVPKVEEAKPKRIEVHAIRALTRTTLDASESAPTDQEQAAASQPGGVDAMREHGHVDSAFVEERGKQA